MTPDRLLDHFDRISDAPDAIPRLRRFILDLAVRGKLVKQDPNDEPASALLRRIQETKLRLIKEGRIKKSKLLETISSSAVPFEIPSSWEWVRLGQISSLITKGSTPTSYGHSYVQSGINFIKVEAIRDSKLVPENVTSYITKETHEFLKRSQLATGDFLFSIAGSIGTCAIVTEAVLPANTNQALAIIRGADVAFLIPFLQYSTRSSLLESALAKARGGAMNNISLEDVSNLLLSLPPGAEQHRIVAKVDELMALCNRLEAVQTERESRRDKLAAASLHQLNNGADTGKVREHARFHLRHLPRLTTRPEHIQQLRQTILNLAVRGKLVPQYPEDEPASELLKRIEAWRSAAIAERSVRKPRKSLASLDEWEAPYELPTSWNWARLGELIFIHSGDGLTAEAMREGSVPVFGGNGITGFHDTPNIHQPTVVIGRVGYYCGSIHVTPSQAWVTDNAFITEFCSDAILQGFLVLLLRATNLKENEKATAQPVISGAKIYPIIVGLPPLAEQHRIVAKVDELMALCNRLEAQFATTQTESRRLLEAVLHEAREDHVHMT